MSTPAESIVVGITGIGVISPYTCSVAHLPRRLMASLEQLPHGGRWSMAGFSPEAYLGRRGFKYMTPAARYAAAAAGMAMNQAGVPYAPEERGVVLGSNFSVYDVTDEMDRTLLAEGVQALSPMGAPNFSVNMAASHVCTRHQCQAFSLTLTNLLVAGMEAVLLGAEAIRKGRARFVLVGATEAAPPAGLTHEFLGGLSEGAACVFALEEVKAARIRGVPVLAEIGGARIGFLSPEQMDDADGEARTKAVFDQLLGALPLSGRRPVAVHVFGLPHRLCRVAAQAVSNRLSEQGRSFCFVPENGMPAPEASVSPLLWLAASVAGGEDAIAVGTSPDGHLAVVELVCPR
jgi:3-oxoacyl-[acyl-carrier-protein] synthase II